MAVDNATIKILVVDDHAMIVVGVRATLEAQPDMTVFGEHISDGRYLLDAVKRLCPDVVVLDVVMPHFHLPSAVRRLISLDPALKIVVFTANKDHAVVHECADLGVQGYLLKDEGDEQMLARIIREIYRGEIHYSPKALEMLEREPGTSVTLSQFQIDVLQLTYDGLEPIDIAQRLGKSVKSIYNVQERLRLKFNCTNNSGLVAEAIRRGLIELR